MKDIKFRARLIRDIGLYKNGDWLYWGILSGFTDPNFAIDKESICQYIGKKDNNGKECYVGDIVRCRGRVGLVIIGKTLNAKVKSHDTWGNVRYYPLSNIEEIIGNKYETPELFNGDKNNT